MEHSVQQQALDYKASEGALSNKVILVSGAVTVSAELLHCVMQTMAPR